MILGKKMAYMNQMDIALKIFKESTPLASQDLEQEIWFHKLMTLLLDQKAKEGISYMQKNKILSKVDGLNNKLLFWIARVYEQAGYNKQAIAIYKKIIDKMPLSFYAIISIEQLKNLKKENKQELIVINRKATYRPNKHLTKKAKKYLQQIHYMALIDDHIFIPRLVNYLIHWPTKQLYNLAIDKLSAKRAISFAIMDTLNANAKHLEVFKLAVRLLNKNIIPLNHEILHLLFPKKFMQEIKNHNKKLDPLLILSLIRQESSFNPNAISHAGARGLMQLMPKTARQYKRYLRSSKLYDPKTNINLGIKYLEKLSNQNNGNLLFALSAYNAGEGNLAYWKKFIFKFKDPIVNIEMIPFRETSDYIKLIYRNLYFYNLLSKNKSFLQRGLKENLRIIIKRPSTQSI